METRQSEHADVTRCHDCCCARSWMALGITEYTGKSIPEHIEELRAQNAELQSIISGLFTHYGEGLVRVPRDHACLACYPSGSDMIIDGFQCVYHRAVELLTGLNLRQKTEMQL